MTAPGRDAGTNNRIGGQAELMASLPSSDFHRQHWKKIHAPGPPRDNRPAGIGQPDAGGVQSGSDGNRKVVVMPVVGDGQWEEFRIQRSSGRAVEGPARKPLTPPIVSASFLTGSQAVAGRICRGRTFAKPVNSIWMPSKKPPPADRPALYLHGGPRMVDEINRAVAGMQRRP